MPQPVPEGQALPARLCQAAEVHPPLQRLPARAAHARRAAAPAPVPAPAPAPAAVVYPNPDGYRAGQGCLRSWEARFNAAGFSCQFSGLYQQVYLYPTGWVSTPIYILFPLCADGSGRIC